MSKKHKCLRKGSDFFSAARSSLRGIPCLCFGQGEKSEVVRRLQERPADEEFSFNWLVQPNTARALAALEADPNLQVVP